MQKGIIKSIALPAVFLIFSGLLSGQTNFSKYRKGRAPVLEKSKNIKDWDFTVAADAEVVFYRDTFRLWYTSSGIPPRYPFPRIGYAWSLDGINWNKYGRPVLEGSSGSWDSLAVETVTVLVDSSAPPGERFKMWYVGTDDPGQSLYHMMGYASSPDGIHWNKSPSNPVLRAESGPTGIDVLGFEGPSVLYDGNSYHMWYTCIPYFGNGLYWDGWINIAYASSADGIHWKKKKDEPVFKVSRSGWDSLFVQTPDVLLIGKTFHMFYTGTASDSSYQSAHGGWHYRVGYAWAPADNMHHWTRYPEPVLRNGPRGSWDDASVGLVSVVYLNGNLHMWYTGQDSCINDANCVWPTVPYWDTGYASDSNTVLSSRGFLFPGVDALRVSPNPFGHEAILRFRKPEGESCTIRFFNSSGALLKTVKNFKGNTLNVSKDELGTGIFFVRVRTAGRLLGTGKFIIQ